MFLHENKELFAQAIDLTSFYMNVTGRIVEKDYYVTMILRLLAERMPFVVFKGGTSLSKCHKTIQRFSEDIDIAVDDSLSQGQKKKLKYAVVDITKELGLRILNLDETRSRRDYNRYSIAYDTILPQLDDMVQSTVLLETSFTTFSFPTVNLKVESMVGNMMLKEAPELIKKYHLDFFEMKVQGIDRTLADKVFAVCDYYLQNRVKNHSRHIYDIFKLLPLVPQDEAFRRLVKEVRVVRKSSNICPSAQDDVDVPALLKKIIKENIYKEDYRNITEKLLEEEVDYNTAVRALEEIAGNGMFV